MPRLPHASRARCRQREAQAGPEYVVAAPTRSTVRAVRVPTFLGARKLRQDVEHAKFTLRLLVRRARRGLHGGKLGELDEDDNVGEGGVVEKQVRTSVVPKQDAALVGTAADGPNSCNTLLFTVSLRRGRSCLENENRLLRIGRTPLMPCT